MYLASLAGEGMEGGGVTRVEGVDRVIGGGREPPPSASWAKNTVITESTQECGHLQSMSSLVRVCPSSRTENYENCLQEGGE